MFDGVIRHKIDPWLNQAGALLTRTGLKADHLSILGAVCAIAMGVTLALGHIGFAFVFLILSRLADGLDGALARQQGISDFGGYLDILCDFIFYAALPLGFAVLDPNENALAAATLLGSFYLNGGSFLGFAVFAAKRGMTCKTRGEKSLYFTTGLAEGSETIAVFVAMLLLPGLFALLAYAFALLCLITFLARMVLAARTFGTG